MEFQAAAAAAATNTLNYRMACAHDEMNPRFTPPLTNLFCNYF